MVDVSVDVAEVTVAVGVVVTVLSAVIVGVAVAVVVWVLAPVNVSVVVAVADAVVVAVDDAVLVGVAVAVVVAVLSWVLVSELVGVNDTELVAVADTVLVTLAEGDVVCEVEAVEVCVVDGEVSHMPKFRGAHTCKISTLKPNRSAFYRAENAHTAVRVRAGKITMGRFSLPSTVQRTPSLKSRARSAKRLFVSTNFPHCNETAPLRRNEQATALPSHRHGVFLLLARFVVAKCPANSRTFRFMSGKTSF